MHCCVPSFFCNHPIYLGYFFFISIYKLCFQKWVPGIQKFTCTSVYLPVMGFDMCPSTTYHRLSGKLFSGCFRWSCSFSYLEDGSSLPEQHGPQTQHGDIGLGSFFSSTSKLLEMCEVHFSLWTCHFPVYKSEIIVSSLYLKNSKNFTGFCIYRLIIKMRKSRKA